MREKWPILAGALGYVGHRATCNRETIRGTLAHANPAAEVDAVLAAAKAMRAAEPRE